MQGTELIAIIGLTEKHVKISYRRMHQPAILLTLTPNDNT